MKLPLQVKGMEVFHDGRGGMSGALVGWVARQARAFPVAFVGCGVRGEAGVVPGAGGGLSAGLVVVRTAEGEVVGGAEALLFCLYSCVAYRDLARRLASPRLLPLVRGACALLVAVRRGCSTIFFRWNDREGRARRHALAGPGGGDARVA